MVSIDHATQHKLSVLSIMLNDQPIIRLYCIARKGLLTGLQVVSTKLLVVFEVLIIDCVDWIGVVTYITLGVIDGHIVLL